MLKQLLKMQKRTVTITKEQTEDTKKLLRLMGVPVSRHAVFCLLCFCVVFVFFLLLLFVCDC